MPELTFPSLLAANIVEEKVYKLVTKVGTRWTETRLQGEFQLRYDE